MSHEIQAITVLVTFEIRSVDQPKSITELNNFLDEYFSGGEREVHAVLGDMIPVPDDADCVACAFTYADLTLAAANIEVDAQIVYQSMKDFCAYPADIEDQLEEKSA